jgi:hypothetical protein
MSTFKELTSADVQTVRTSLNQLIDVVQNDISGSSTRRKYQMFITSSADETGAVYAVTSSLFQTVHDQDYTLQIANPIFDLTVGIFEGSDTVNDSYLGDDSTGKLLFPSSSVMMREKVDLYKLYAGKLLGDSSDSFYAPFESADTTNRIDEAIFISFKRLFTRDKLKRESFAMRFYTTGVIDGSPNSSAEEKAVLNLFTGSNISRTSTFGATLFTDVGSSLNRNVTFGGEVGEISNAANSSEKVGLIFYDAGILVLDAKKVMWADQHVSGVISATTRSLAGVNTTVIGSAVTPGSNPSATFIPDFFVSSSIDDIVNHISTCRFSSGSYTAMTFQNQTTINSTLFFCRATADEFNYSTNPTYTNDQNEIVVIDPGQEDVQTSFTYPTTVGLYDANNNLLAVAKFSRPIEKHYEKDLTVRVRLDF